ncbi:MAG: hypothetical protein EA378_09875 [Phycisphaerales bacterium]|nr:MAG: hypothetical protein EA378_09875 [Phycisphaerales bacterium]
MSVVEALNGVAPKTSGTNGFDALSSEQFMKIVLTELSQQDPFEPQDTSALIQQLSDLRSIESNEALGRQLGALVAQNELASAAGLIGKIVSGLDTNNTRVIDYVVSVTRTADGAILNLQDGARVKMSQVDEIVTEDVLFGDPFGSGGSTDPDGADDPAPDEDDDDAEQTP